ncbi:MAG: hemerythrin domain-containing protein [Sedimentisphaerales bacterium]|nr:hemerythrin domain-containing protein [Sedimentisphaerales bacterium]
MKKTPQDKRRQVLTRFLRRIDKADDLQLLRGQAHRILAQITPQDLAGAELELVEKGYSAHLASQLSVAFLLIGTRQTQNEPLRDRLPTGHILRLVLAEHELLDYYLSDLEEVAGQIDRTESLSDSSSEFMRLSHIVEHLYAMAEHIEREEDVIFPYLRQYGWTSLCLAAQKEHDMLRDEVDTLLRLIGAFRTGKQGEFKLRLAAMTRSFCDRARNHIRQEEKILYPVALEVVKDPQVWNKIKAVCNEIGYCGVHL